MALNLASGLQVSAHFFWNRRNAAALSHHGVRMEFDPVQRQRASLILGFIFALLAVALMFVLSWFKPAGQVGQSTILADRDTGAIFVLVDGRLHPAVNLISARLIAGQANNPTFVKANELAKYPQGASVGIAGAPAAMPLRTADSSEWTVCDSAADNPNAGSPRHGDRRTADRRIARHAARLPRRRCWPSTTTRPMSSGTGSGRRSTCPTRRSRWRSASTPTPRSR